MEESLSMSMFATRADYDAAVREVAARIASGIALPRMVAEIFPGLHPGKRTQDGWDWPNGCGDERWGTAGRWFTLNRRL